MDESGTTPPPPGPDLPGSIPEPTVQSTDSTTATASRLPIQLTVVDDLTRSRLTVFLRAILTLPCFVWLVLWGILIYVVALVLWVAVIILGRAPEGLHRFAAAYVRYSVHVGAYISLTANPWPGFFARPGYPVDVEIDPPQPQHRLGALFRGFLALPAVLLASAMGGTVGFYPNATILVAGMLTGLLLTCALLVWFSALWRGRAPSGLRDLSVLCLSYGAQTAGYLLFLTSRYPWADPESVSPPPRTPAHPVTLHASDSLHRSRLTVLFRILLALPHLIWLLLWTILALLAGIVGWFATLITGRLPLPFHRFLSAWIRYGAHVLSFLFVVAGPFPGFVGAAGSYPIDIELAPPERQSRWRTLFRGFLAIPALFVSSGLLNILYFVGFFTWWYSLVLGRAPEGLRDLGTVCIRYQAQVNAYLYLLTERYPHSSPARTASAPEVAATQLELAPVDVEPDAGPPAPPADPT